MNEDEQMSLIDVPEICEYDLPDANYREHTAARLRLKEPKRYEAVLSALKVGMPMMHVAGAYKLSRNTVAAVVHLEFSSVEQWREQCGKAARGAALALVDKAGELAGTSTKLGEVAMAAKLMSDIGMVAAGEATHITEVRHTVPALDSLKEAFNASQIGLRTGKTPAMAQAEPVLVREIEATIITPSAQPVGNKPTDKQS